MKANEAPERIYLVIDPIWSSMSVNYNRNDTNNIEYIREDAFIKKAWDWIEDNLLSSNQQDKLRLYFEQFKKYAKGVIRYETNRIKRQGTIYTKR